MVLLFRFSIYLPRTSLFISTGVSPFSFSHGQVSTHLLHRTLFIPLRYHHLVFVSSSARASFCYIYIHDTPTYTPFSSSPPLSVLHFYVSTLSCVSAGLDSWTFRGLRTDMGLQYTTLPLYILHTHIIYLYILHSPSALLSWWPWLFWSCLDFLVHSKHRPNTLQSMSAP